MQPGSVTSPDHEMAHGAYVRRDFPFAVETIDPFWIDAFATARASRPHSGGR